MWDLAVNICRMFIRSEIHKKPVRCEVDSDCGISGHTHIFCFHFPNGIYIKLKKIPSCNLVLHFSSLQPTGHIFWQII